MDELNIRCSGIEFLNQCEYAYLGNGFFGCKLKDTCFHQKPPWRPTAQENAGDDEAGIPSDFWKWWAGSRHDFRGWQPLDVAVAVWKAALTHERATVQEAIRLLTKIRGQADIRPPSFVDEIDAFIAAFITANNHPEPQKNTGGEFCE